MKLKITRTRVVHLSLLILASRPARMETPLPRRASRRAPRRSRIFAEALIEFTELSALTCWALAVTIVCQVNSLAEQKFSGALTGLREAQARDESIAKKTKQPWKAQ